MICIRCKREIPDGAAFCPWCGKRQPETAPPAQRKKRRRPRGSGSVYKMCGVRQKPYIALSSKREVIGIYETSGEAIRALDAYVSQNRPISKLKYTFADVYAKWSEAHYQDVGAKGRSSYELAYKKAERLWDRPVRDLVTEDYQVVIDDLANAGMSRSMCEKQRQLFSQICKWSMANGITSHNFAEELRLPAGTGKKTRVLTKEEISRIQSVADDRSDPMNTIARISIVLYYTGMRINELLSMRRDDVHLDEGYLIGGEKTEAGRKRVIPILDPIKMIIADWMLDSMGNELLLPAARGGKQRSESATEKAFKALMKRCDIEGAVPHTMRHTAATRLVQGKAEPTAVQAILGHADFSTTANYYTGHDAEYLKKEMKKFDK